MLTTSKIRMLPQAVRLAGYLARLARLDEGGAKLRTAYKDDDEWSNEEKLAWDELCDELDPWHHALTEEERALLSPAVDLMACLCRGEVPDALAR